MFRGCISLIPLPDISYWNAKNLTKISKSAFSSCTGLTSVVIPDNVTTIDGLSSIYGAFQDCSNLNKVLIPDSVASIAGAAFDGCKKLTIYGNDNQASKQYAEDKKISFDYISNWNKSNGGSDITSPTVKEINIKNKTGWDSTTSTYKVSTDYTIVIVVVFSEDITGTGAPTLTIKCGNGNNINLTSGEIAGKNITYTYKIKSTDIGQIATVKLEGGNITDKSGNKAILSCPAFNELFGVYANGIISKSTQDSITIIEKEENAQTEKEEKGDKEKQGDSKQQTTSEKVVKTQENSNDEKDTTIKKASKLPQTGTALISVAIVTLLGLTIISKIKYGRYKDVV